MHTNKRRKITTIKTTAKCSKLLHVACLFGLLLLGIQIERVTSAPASEDANADATITTTFAVETSTIIAENSNSNNSSNDSNIVTTTVDTSRAIPITTIPDETTIAIEHNANAVPDSSMTSTTATTTTTSAAEAAAAEAAAAAATSTVEETTTATSSANNKLDAVAATTSTTEAESSSSAVSHMTSIEPITSTEPTTTPLYEQETVSGDNETGTENEIKTGKSKHIQHIPPRDGHGHGHGHEHEYGHGHQHEHVHEHVTSKPVPVRHYSTTERHRQQQQLQQQHQQQQQQHSEQFQHNQITSDNEDDVKDLNNFRHPETLITASNSEETQREAENNDAVQKPKPDVVYQVGQQQHEEREEDPYHVHILSENHDRLAEHEDYQMLSSTEDAVDAASSTTSTTATTTTTTAANTTTTQASLFTGDAKLDNSEEHKATGDTLFAESSTEASGATTTTTTTTMATTTAGSDAVRARAMHINDASEEDIPNTTMTSTSTSTTTTTTTTTTNAPFINIIEGQHEQHLVNEAETTTPTTTPSPSPSTSTTTEHSNSPFIFANEGRANSGSDADLEYINRLSNNDEQSTTTASHSHAALMDLSNVSMDEEHEQSTMKPLAREEEAKGTPEMPTIVEVTAADAMHRECAADGRNYQTGESMERGCDERCTCNRGEWICEPRCKGTSYPRGSQRSMANPNCREEAAEDDGECCRVMVCGELLLEPTVATSELNAADPMANASTPKSRLDCHYMGGTYKFRERLEIGCEQICHCDDDGQMNCRPRCPERNHTRLDKCVYVKDPKDVCCQLELCDVTLDDHEQQSVAPLATHNSIGEEQQSQSAQSESQSFSHEEQARDAGSTIEAASIDGGNVCEFKGATYRVGQQFRDGCEQLCICNAQGVHCAKMECPTTFGLDVLNPHCLRWEPVPADFKPIAPNCCPESMRCVDNGTCTYQGEMFDNWSPIPTNLTGCEQHCYCENGKVECRPACPPVLALPPAELPCHPAQARLMPIPDDECCKHWSCAPLTPKLSGSTDAPTHDSSSEVTPAHVTTTKTTTTTMTTNNLNNNNNVLPAMKPNDYDKKPLGNAFYPTLDGKPPKLPPGLFNEYKSEKHDKPIKKTKPQQNDVKYDVHEQQDDLAPPPGSSFIPIHLGGGGGLNPYDQYNHNLAQQQQHHQHRQHQQQLQQQHHQQRQQQQAAHLGPYGFYNRQKEPPYDPYNPYDQYDINPNGIPTGKLPAPTSQSDLFNLLGAGVPGGVGNPGVGSKADNSNNLPPHVRIEHILQHLQPGPGHAQQQPQQPIGPFVGQGPLNGSGPGNGQQQQQRPQQQQPPHYVPIVHTGVPPPPPPHSIAIVDGQPVAFESYPVIPGLGGPLPLPTHQQHQQQQQSHQQHQHQQQQQQAATEGLSSITTTTSTASNHPPLVVAPAAGLSAQASEHSLHQPATTDRMPATIATSSPPSPPPPPTSSPQAAPAQAGFENLQADIEVHTLEAIDPRTIRIVFTVPQVYVNLHGRVELRYTNGPGNDTANWEQQIFAPPEDLIATSQMEFDLPGLEPNSLYKVKITLILRDINAQPSSSVYNVKTPPEREITPPPQITDYRPDFQDIFKHIEDPELNVSETNSTWLQLTWKKLSDEQLEYVDGVQLRYKELTGMIYSSSPLIHRTLTTYTIENLQSDTGYEIGLYYIPFPGHGAELRAGHMIKVRTAPKVDVYGFDVMVNVTKVKAQSVEVSWSGVPYPEDKYVNIYRAIYQSDAGKEDSSVFKVAKRDSTTGTLIMDLKPGTKYRLWLEMYLTNGNIKKSNVVNFITKPGGPATPGKTGKLLTAGVSEQPVGDYYGPLVVVSVVAALAIMSTLVLLLIITRRRVHQTAAITPPRKSDAAYDNPSYKVEIQQETMNL